MPRGSGAQPATALVQMSRLANAEFTHISSVRELPDGVRVLITDDYGRQILVGDFVRGGAAVIGRHGDGPGEYRTVGTAFALAGDTTLVTDGGNKRWLVLAGTKVARTLTLPLGDIRGTSELCGASVRNFVCAVVPRRFRAAANGDVPLLRGYADVESTAIIRRPLTGASADTVVVLRGRFRSVGRTTKDGMVWIYYHPLGIEDQAVMFPDGWMAVVQAEPARVDWFDPAGKRTGGAALASRRVLLDERQKKHVIAAYEPTYARAGFVPSDFARWPAVLPPFPNRALHAAPGGAVLIERTRAAEDSATLFDLVDRQGRLVRSLSVPAGARVVGLSTTYVYLARRDEDDVETLARFRWPR
jgi:hypothetical protein